MSHHSPARPAVLVLMPIFILAVAFVSIKVHWICALVLNPCLLLAGLVLLKPSVGMHVLFFAVPTTSFICYAALKEPWNFVTGVNYIDAASISMPLILLTSLSLVLGRWAGSVEAAGRNPLKFPLILLTSYAAATVFWSDGWSHSLFQFLILLSNVLLFCLTVALIRSKAMLERALWIWSLSMAFQAVFALAAFFFDAAVVVEEVLPGIVAGFHFFGGFLQPSGWPRVASGLQDHHETSLLMNMASSVLLGLLLTASSKRRKLLAAALLLLVLFVSLRTESRAGFGALMITGTVMFVLLARLRSKLIRLSIFFCLFVVLLYTAQQEAISLIIQKDFTPRLFSLGIKAVESGDAIDPEIKNKKHSRRKLWQNSFRKYSKVFVQGFGVGNLKKEMLAPHAHSIFFSLWFDFGLVGLLVLAWLACYLAAGMIPPLLTQKTRLQVMVSAMTGGIMVVCIQGLVDFEYNTTTIWLQLALTTSAIEMARQEAREAFQAGPASVEAVAC